MKAMLITMAVVAMLLGAAFFTAAPATDFTEANPTPDVNADYREFVSGMSDCAGLQAFFDRAYETLQTDRMKIADDQMRRVGCYNN